MATRKPSKTFEQVVYQLINEAEDASEHYMLTHNYVMAYDVVREAFVYGYILSALSRRPTSDQHGGKFQAKQIVIEAMRQRFAMSDEDIAIDVIGG